MGGGCAGRRREERLAELDDAAAGLDCTCCWTGRLGCVAGLPSTDSSRRRLAEVFGLVRVVVVGGRGGGVGSGSAAVGPSEDSESGSGSGTGMAAKRSPKSASWTW